MVIHGGEKNANLLQINKFSNNKLFPAKRPAWPSMGSRWNRHRHRCRLSIYRTRDNSCRGPVLSVSLGTVWYHNRGWDMRLYFSSNLTQPNAKALQWTMVKCNLNLHQTQWSIPIRQEGFSNPREESAVRVRYVWSLHLHRGRVTINKCNGFQYPLPVESAIICKIVTGDWLLRGGGGRGSTYGKVLN